MSINDIKHLPELNYLLECFEYNKEDGILYWKIRPLYHFKNNKIMKAMNSKLSGKIAGTLSSKGYINIALDKKHYMAHRIIWKLYYGIEPTALIDHINGNKDDNRIENLREVTHLENCRNIKKLNKFNKSGYTGVHLCKKTKKWFAFIYLKGKSISLGSFGTIEEAIAAREEGVNKFYGEHYNRSKEGELVWEV